MQVEVFIGSKSLHALLDEIAIGHGVSDGDHFFTPSYEDFSHPSGGLTFSAACTNGANCDNGLCGFHPGFSQSHQPERGASPVNDCRFVHDVAVRDIAVCEYHFVDAILLDQGLQF